LGRENCLIVLLDKRLQLKRKNKSVVIHFVVVDGAVCGVCLRSNWGLCASRALVLPYPHTLLYFNFFDIPLTIERDPFTHLKKKSFPFLFFLFLWDLHTFLFLFSFCLFSFVFSHYQFRPNGNGCG
jgi:hypothetical protein